MVFLARLGRGLEVGFLNGGSDGAGSSVAFSAAGASDGAVRVSVCVVSDVLSFSESVDAKTE